MDRAELLTAEEFVSRDPETDLEQRWSELEAGRIIHLAPPDVQHGTIVFNLSRALARHLQSHPEEVGYAAFELGLIVARNPDTVRRPAVSFFTTGPRFAELDCQVTETRPALVVEVASTNDRRRTVGERIENYLAADLPLIWVIDPAERCVGVFGPGNLPQTLAGERLLQGGAAIPGFELPVEDLFLEPG